MGSRVHHEIIETECVRPHELVRKGIYRLLPQINFRGTQIGKVGIVSHKRTKKCFGFPEFNKLADFGIGQSLRIPLIRTFGE